MSLFICSGQNSTGSESLYRKIILPKFFDRKAIWPNHHLTEHRLTECYLTESSFDWIAVKLNAVWPIFFSDNSHLTESTFDKKSHLTEKNAHKVVWPKIHWTERSSFDRMFFFWKMVDFEKLYLTERSYSIRIVHVPNVFVAARCRTEGWEIHF
jgi:hypothetical protein